MGAGAIRINSVCLGDLRAVVLLSHQLPPKNVSVSARPGLDGPRLRSGRGAGAAEAHIIRNERPTVKKDMKNFTRAQYLLQAKTIDTGLLFIWQDPAPDSGRLDLICNDAASHAESACTNICSQDQVAGILSDAFACPGKQR